MIDWMNVAWNASWILGLSIALAAISYARWEAGLLHEKISTRLNQPAYQAALHGAGLLFCLGLGGTAAPAWQKTVWFLLAGLSLIMGILAVRPQKSQP
jgi:hypothetical protein